MKVAELEAPLLDYWVAKAEGLKKRSVTPGRPRSATDEPAKVPSFRHRCRAGFRPSTGLSCCESNKASGRFSGQRAIGGRTEDT